MVRSTGTYFTRTISYHESVEWVGWGPSLQGAYALLILGFGTIFNVRLRECACDQRNYWRKNKKTGPDPFFFSIWGHICLCPPPRQKKQTNKQKTRVCNNEQECEVRTPFLKCPYPIFLSSKRPFKQIYSIGKCWKDDWLTKPEMKARFCLDFSVFFIAPLLILLTFFLLSVPFVLKTRCRLQRSLTFS